MKKYNVGIIGATGMVGQRFSLLLDKHPWFNVVCVAASPRSAGKKLKDAVAGKWKLSEPLPEAIGELTVLNAEEDVEKIASMVDFVFCAVDMKKDEIRALEEKYAKAECPVVSNNSAHRHTPDVPMVIPEVNPEHIEIIASQRKRLGTKRGFIAVKSNCSLQSYVPALAPLMDKYKVTKALVRLPVISERLPVFGDHVPDHRVSAQPLRPFQHPYRFGVLSRLAEALRLFEQEFRFMLQLVMQLVIIFRNRFIRLVVVDHLHPSPSFICLILPFLQDEQTDGGKRQQTYHRNMAHR